MCLCIDIVLLIASFVLGIFGITEKGISTRKKLFRFLIMVMVIGSLVVGSLMALGVL